jgi:hypothetical protein
MLRCAISAVLMVACASADEGEVARRVEELTAKYCALGGYLATYESRVENKSLVARIGHDHASDRFVIHVEIEIDGKRDECRQWNDAEGILYMLADGHLFRTPGLKEGAAFLNSWNALRAPSEPREAPAAIKMVPGILLLKSHFEGIAGASMSKRPLWLSRVQVEKIDEVSDDSVVFATEKHGRLTVGRAHGMVTRQVIIGEAGNERVLVLKDLRINPGEAAVSGVSAGWSTLGTEEASAGPLLVECLFQIFQEVIDGIEAGRVELPAVMGHLEKEQEAWKRFAAGLVTDGPDSLSARMNWEEVLGAWRDGLVTAWKRGEVDKSITFQTYLERPEVRRAAREGLVKKLLASPEVRQLILKESLADRRLESTGINGKAAAESLESALVRAYLEALVERKMSRHWDALE